MALHPDGKTIATGQIGPKPKLCLWNAETMQEITFMVAPLTKGIKNLAFS